MSLNETHDAALRSWAAPANDPGADFPLQNLPFGVFRRARRGEHFRGGVAIGDAILDLQSAVGTGLLGAEHCGTLAARAALAASQRELNGFMALGPQLWSALRAALSR